MKALMLLAVPIVGCATAQTASRSDVEEMRNEIRILRQELDDAKSQKAFYEFKRGRRISKPKDLRNDLPKGVAR